MGKRAKGVVAAWGLFVTMGFWAMADWLASPREHRARSNESQRRIERFASAYDAWRVSHELDGGDRNVTIALSWSKGLSTEFTRARGSVTLDLETGGLSAEVQGVPEKKAYALWLVDNQKGPERSVRPENGDRMLRVGRMNGSSESLRLATSLNPRYLRDFEVDLVVLTPAGVLPSESILLTGSPSLFQRLYTRTRSAVHQRPPATLLSRLFGDGQLPLVHASASVPSDTDVLLDFGEDLFFNETFDGNGRTCGTCHPAENNFTIDPEFIAGLPDTDPLFVAEFNPDLAENFEKPVLMRSLGLILENADGFDDLPNKFVMRGVPHTLAMATSLGPAPPGTDGSTVPPDERTGWSGDGSPGSGTLREFAIGAVTQHFPRTLARVAGSDFRLPTDEELDAMAAFQLSLGRAEDLDIASLRLVGPRARRGREIFLTADTAGGTVAAGKCNVCHSNAGATLAGVPGANFNFDTGVEALADQPADTIDPANNPPDGGFGRDPHPIIPGAFGNGTFNTPTLVEAADTGPFFHNNAVLSMEEAVNFYNSTAFNESPAGRFLASADSGAIAIRLEATQVEAVAAFLRVINALENIRSTLALQDTARVLTFPEIFEPVEHSPELVVSLAEIDDAIDVLRGAALHPDAVTFLERARVSTVRAIESTGHFGSCRNARLDEARTNLLAARRRLALD